MSISNAVAFTIGIQIIVQWPLRKAGSLNKTINADYMCPRTSPMIENNLKTKLSMLKYETK